MASNFQIKVSAVRGQTDDLVRCVNKLNNAISGAESVRNRLEIDQVYSSLQNVINALYSEKDKMMKMQLNLHSILREYDNTESRIKSNAKVGSTVKKPGGNTLGHQYFNNSPAKDDKKGENKYSGNSYSGNSYVKESSEDGLKDLPNNTKENVVEKQTKDDKLNLWNEFWQTYRDNFVSNVRDALFESTGNTIVRVGGLINVATSVARSKPSTTGFVIVNPTVATKTSKMISFGSKVATGAKYGLPVLGGIIDYATLRKSGKSVKESGIKAGGHLVIGVAGGAAGGKIGAAAGAAIGSIIPGAGTAIGGIVGGVIGFAAGALITTVGNTAFDMVYDNWGTIKKKGSNFIEGTKNLVKSVKNEYKRNGIPIPSKRGLLGTLFG